MRARVAGMAVRISREVCVPGKRVCVQGTKGRDATKWRGAGHMRRGACRGLGVGGTCRTFTTRYRKYFPVLHRAMEWYLDLSPDYLPKKAARSKVPAV